MALHRCMAYHHQHHLHLHHDHHHSITITIMIVSQVEELSRQRENRKEMKEVNTFNHLGTHTHAQTHT
jgi:hypothetical protein